MLEISKAFLKLDIKRRKTQYGFDQAPRASSGDLAANNQFITYLQIFCIKLLSKNIVNSNHLIPNNERRTTKQSRGHNK